jgi:hypothetical protein
MGSLIRAIYRILIKNRLIRWVWILGLSLWGVKWLTDNAIIKKKSFFSKTILAIPKEDIHTFTIQKANDEEIIFTRNDANWLIVKNDVTISVSEDSVAAFLTVFNKMESSAIKKLSENTADDEAVKKAESRYLYKIFINHKNSATDSISVFYTVQDSLSDDTLTFVQINNERILHGVKNDLMGLLRKDFNDFRSKKLLNFSRANATKLVFLNPLDTAIFYAKDTVNWTFFNNKNSVLSDSLNAYLKSIGILRGGRFYDASRDFKENKNIDNQLVIYTKDDSTKLTAYRRERLFILHSSSNNDNYFQIDSTNDIFKKATDFIRVKSKSSF